MSRRSGGRFREPVALTEAAVLGLAGVIAALAGPWKWLAILAGPAIFAVVLVMATWRRRDPKSAPAERHATVLIRQWANGIADDDPARAQADAAVELADGIDDLTLQCERAIAHLDGPAQLAAKESLGKVTDYLKQSVATWTGKAPARARDWSALAERLKTAYKSLLDELERT